MKDASTDKGLRAAQRDRERQEVNRRELAAWNEWKTVCRIFRCSPENRGALISRMWISSRKKLDALLASENANWRDEYTPEEWGGEIGKVFDAYIREGERDAKRLNYKDLIWTIIRKGKDEPLNVIRGKLTARHSVLDNVLERFVVKHGLAVGVDAHRALGLSVSLNEKVGEGEDAVEKIDLLPAVDGQPPLPRDVRLDWFRRFGEMFNYQECVILLAYFRRVAFTDEVVVEAAGVKNSRAGEILKGRFVDTVQVQEGLLDKLACLQGEFRALARDYGQVAVAEMVVAGLKEIAGTEKRATRLLSRIEEIEKNAHERH